MSAESGLEVLPQREPYERSLEDVGTVADSALGSAVGPADGTGGSADAVTGAAMGPYRKSGLSMLSCRMLRTLNQEPEQEIE